ncbi:hypothetical protein [Nocardia brasiliensis]|uniref:hypothetical protein n=1 Tax=Nocardia brasiliensis TaxID=37326 RepID=UPI003D8D5010
MCDDLTLGAEKAFGEIYRLCNRPVECVLNNLKLRPQSTKRGNDQPARSLLEVFCSKADVLIVENGYFDLDYRSEFSKVHDTRFRPQSFDTTRIHFFKGKVSRRRRHIRDFVDHARHDYYGYAVIRPQLPGKVGRSIVSSDLGIDDIISDRSLGDKVRTAIVEEVQVFGVMARVAGVPFMEQDGHLLTCAHIAAWSCHYTAVLRGLVPRRATAEFHGISDRTTALGRPYPSQGLSLALLTATLRAMDLPPEVLDADSLAREIEPNWSHPTVLSEKIQETRNKLKDVEGDEEAEAGLIQILRRIWIKENLRAHLCRYLNSGFPVILLRPPEVVGEVAHAQVAVGYLQRRDLDSKKYPSRTKERDVGDLDSDMIAIIVCDDQNGPYNIVLLDTLVDEFAAAESGETAIVAPLPKAVWLSGESAEEASIDWLKNSAIVKRREHSARRGRLPLPRWARRSTRDAGRTQLNLFYEEVTGEQPDKLAIRTYVTTGVEFKNSLADRLKEERQLLRAVGNIQLPKYVWVSEAIDRQLRGNRVDSVRATVVFDSTGVVVGGRAGAANLIPLLVHIPGQAFCGGGSDIDKPVVNQEWFPCTAQPYATGRWNRQNDKFGDKQKQFRAQNWKTAMSGN